MNTDSAHLSATQAAAKDATGASRVALMITCLADLLRPQIGFATVELLEAAGCLVEVPEQTCCGQPAFNQGDMAKARSLAKDVIGYFERYDYLVIPSGSCAGMVKMHYAHLFTEDAEWRIRAQLLADKTYELMTFLSDVKPLPDDFLAARRQRLISQQDTEVLGKVTYHDACSGLRELGVRDQPRKLLKAIGVDITEASNAEVCCGFGGAFCVKYPEISTRMADRKLQGVAATAADTLISGDMGCLMHLQGRSEYQGQGLRSFHVAEVLAGFPQDLAGDNDEGH